MSDNSEKTTDPVDVSHVIEFLDDSRIGSFKDEAIKGLTEQARARLAQLKNEIEINMHTVCNMKSTRENIALAEKSIDSKLREMNSLSNLRRELNKRYPNANIK